MRPTPCSPLLRRRTRLTPATGLAPPSAAIYLFKKALILVHTVSLRFAPAGAASAFPCPDTTALLPVFSDNVIPSLLLSSGLVTLPADSPILAAFPRIEPGPTNALLKAKTDRAASKQTPAPLGGPVLTVQQATLLRAAAVFACERLAEFARAGGVDEVDGCAWVKDDVTATGVDGYVWAGGKAKPEWRKIERFVCDSIFY